MTVVDSGATHSLSTHVTDFIEIDSSPTVSLVAVKWESFQMGNAWDI